MKQVIAINIMVRFVLPLALILSIALRPFGLSIVYLFIYFCLPLLHLSHRKRRRWTSFLFAIVIVSVILFLTHIAWHATLAAFLPYGSLLVDYPLIEKIGKALGLVVYTDIDSLTAIIYIMPEMIMSAVSIIVYICVRKILSEANPNAINENPRFRKHVFLATTGKYISLFLVMFSGIFQPNVLSGTYYLLFIACATSWSLLKLSDKGFAVVGRCVMAIMAMNCIVIIVYQVPYLVEELYTPEQPLARYFGLHKLVVISDTKPEFVYQVARDHKWINLINPLVLLITYFILGVTTQTLLKPKPIKLHTREDLIKPNGNLNRRTSLKKEDDEKWLKATKRYKVAFPYISSKVLRGTAADSTPLIQHQSGIDLTNTKPYQDSLGSIVLPDNETTAPEITEEKTSLKNECVVAVVEFFQVLIRSSYIMTTITMMAWSIMFHSWLTFVFLMWANIVWLRQDQRSFMLKSSPVLVLYATALLLIQYIYGMELTKEELPTKVLSMKLNLRQIGVGRPEGEPFVPLLIKTLFTCMFWITLRQWVQEIKERRRKSIAVPMMQIQPSLETKKPSRFLAIIGNWMRVFCARYWIYVVVIMLFVIGITGERMTIFRITYMALFLTFILMFQISWYWWRRFMYTFWIIVIVYSMINLILIYIYQFDNSSKLIEDYLGINKRLQNDLGLEPYHPADLFVKLLTPTCFLIITIMQVHYFHKDFMSLSDPVTRTNSIRDMTRSRRGTHSAAHSGQSPHPTFKEGPAETEEAKHSKADDAKSLVVDTEMSSYSTMKRKQSRYTESGVTERPSTAIRTYLISFFKTAKETLLGYTNKVCLYLEIHLIKIIFFSIMLLCVMNVCAMHVPLIFIVSVALLLKSRKQKAMVLFISTIISIYLMAKMVYQIEYINHSFFDINCTVYGANNTLNYTTYNGAEWLGFTKASKAKPLVSVLKGYIGLIAAFVFYSLISYRQQIYRQLGILPRNKNKLIFPNIRREDADKDILHCLKYLVNYCFYKFGVELTLISLIAVIGSRMDVYSVFYSGWLLVLVAIKRERQSRIWGTFTGCIVILVPFQYVLALGFMPQFCFEYPWSGNEPQVKNIRTWLFLPYPTEPPKAAKLIFDYILLLMASRQMRVFTIEKTAGEDYPGGSNQEDVGLNWETPSFVNPVPDFLISIGTWLDVIKRMIFLGMLWVTLAIMFLTGTNRVNLFSMGYLIGSFIFLWQGTDFYLRPKHTILQWWSWLLYYNVFVVVIKALLQIPGCIFSTLLQEHACWLVQLLGIGCVDKFSGGNIASFIKMKYLKEATCTVPQEDIGLAWDGVCFAFLILQRRLFRSYYFYRVIDESKATTMLASRGADLIEELRLKQMKVQENQEIRILEKIKIKMERIKANQKKIQGVVSKEAPHHDADDEDDEDMTQPEETERVPLIRADTDGSGRGYHTPESPASPKGFHTPISEPSAPPSPSRQSHPINPLPPLPILPPTSSIGGPPSPSSALMTHSLDAYLEPRRISFESPPNSELIQRAQTPEESYPVFSPPPIRRRHTVASPNVTHRASIISQSSRGDRSSHHASSERSKVVQPASHQQAVRSGDYYMFDEFDDTELPLGDDEEDVPKNLGISHLLVKVFMDNNKPGNLALQRRRSAPVAISSDRPVLSDHPYSDPNQYGTPERRGLASTSERDMPMSEIELIDEKETWVDKILRVLGVIINLIRGLTLTLALYLMRFSRDYRYVSRTLSYEKKCLKEKPGFGIGIREGTHMIWEPLPNTQGAGHQHDTGDSTVEKGSDNHLHVPEMGRKLSDISVPEIRILAPSMERGLDGSPLPARVPRPASADRSVEADSSDDTSEHESAFSLESYGRVTPPGNNSMFDTERSVFVQFSYALWYSVLAHTDVVCFIMVFINQIQSATILSIPLPLMVFLWGTLSIPRPTKTFWVTLIAYTEVIVLIKSMFQFEILPWNQKAVPANTPFTAPRIIGIERKHNYALYDLLLLLIIFLHRFMLKSLGLWKEATPEFELREDNDYEPTAEDTQLIMEGKRQEVGKKYLKLHDQTGAGHRLVNRFYYVQATIEYVVRELKTTYSDPRVAMYVGYRFRKATRRKTTIIDQPQLLKELQRYVTDSLRQPGREPPMEQELSESAERWRSSTEQQRLHITDQAINSDDSVPGPSKTPPDEEKKEVEEEQDSHKPVITVTTTQENPYMHYPTLICLAVKRYMQPTKRFFEKMLEPGARVTADIYAYMFLCDFFNFLVVIFGFAAFGTHQGDGGVQAYLEENKVPIPFLVMLILQFVLIIVDRALYLRKFILGKILFQYALIIGVHVWMFFVLPFITERTFNSLLPPPMWYMVKCIYLLLSAYQIRCGYPRRIIGNFLCKSYTFLNMLLFRGFMAVPFLFELRTLMDWIWTDTSMTLMDWLKMEDIFASVFLLKCSRYMESEFPQPRGAKKSNTSKYVLGGGVLAFVIAIIWFPLVFFAFGNSVGEPNPPSDITVKIRIGPFLPVYQMSAQSHNIAVFSEGDYSLLSNLYARDRNAQTFLSNYMYNDVAVIMINPNSTSKWQISPPELERLEREAASKDDILVKFTYVLTHPSNTAQNPPTMEDSREVTLHANIGGNRNPERRNLYKMLIGKAEEDTWLNVRTLFPKFVKVFNKGQLKPASQLMPPLSPTEDKQYDSDAKLYRDVQLRLERHGDAMYWRVRESCQPKDALQALPLNNCDMLVMYTFNDKLFPETLNLISGSGIIGLYTTFVFLAARVLRGFFSGIYTKIMFDDLPNADRVLQLCLDIYLVREALELSLEEDLFAKLVFLYRSPETMIKWSRPKEEEEPRAVEHHHQD